MSGAPMSPLEALRLRLGTRYYNVVREHPAVRESVAAALTGTVVAGLGAENARLERLAAASRHASSGPVRALLRREMAPRITGPGADVWRDRRIGWGRHAGPLREPLTLTTSLVLKAPGPDGEKGVIYSSFEHNLIRLLANPKARQLFEEYHVVMATSWSPPDYTVFASCAGIGPDPVFACISNVQDIETYRLCEPAIRPVDIMACDWVEPSYYAPKPRTDRAIDILMVANWLRFKRHWILFRALRRMPRDLRVVLVGHKNQQRNVDHVRAEARAWGVPQDLEFETSLGIDQVTARMCDAKIAALFSRREGSCVSVVECFFADTPVAMMDDAHVGARAYINPQTGRLFSHRDVAGQLMRMLEERDTFRPRAWADAHLTAARTSAKLNAIVRARASETGSPWTVDLAPMCWRHVPTYLEADAPARFAAEEARLRDVYGITLTKYPHVTPPPAARIASAD